MNTNELRKMMITSCRCGVNDFGWYCAGAKDMQERMLNKTVEWLEAELFNADLIEGCKNQNELIEKFKKDMMDC